MKSNGMIPLFLGRRSCRHDVMPQSHGAMSALDMADQAHRIHAMSVPEIALDYQQLGQQANLWLHLAGLAIGMHPATLSTI
eukprot:2687033-Rhodomonas_salina.4